MSNSTRQRSLKSLINATSIKFVDSPRVWVTMAFDIDGVICYMLPRVVQSILSDSEFIEAREAFIDNLTNPAEFMKTAIAKTNLKLPKELKLKAKMVLLNG